MRYRTVWSWGPSQTCSRASVRREVKRALSQGLAVILAPGPATWAAACLTSSSPRSPHPPPPLEAQWPQGVRPQGWDDRAVAGKLSLVS